MNHAENPVSQVSLRSLTLRALSLGLFGVVAGGCTSNLDDTTSIHTSSNGFDREEFPSEFVSATATRLEEVDFPGAAVAVFRADGRSWSHGFGYANLATGKPMTADTLLPVASVTQLLTTVAVMQAVQSGALELDEDISPSLPFTVSNPNFPNEAITLRHLLTHSSGIVDNNDLYRSTTVFNFGGDHSMKLGDFLEQYLTPEGTYYSQEDNFGFAEPGELTSYSNIAFSLAAYVVESATGQPFNELTRNNILEPLGMTASGWFLSEVDTENAALQYGLKEGPLSEFMTGEPSGQWRAYLPYGMVTYPDGGLRTSVTEFTRFMTAVMNGGTLEDSQILRPETVAAMLAPQDLGEQNAEALREEGLAQQALGFAYLSQPGVPRQLVRVGHLGGDPGTNTLAYFDPSTDVGVVLLVNSDAPSEQGGAVFFQLAEDLMANAESLIGTPQTM